MFFPVGSLPVLHLTVVLPRVVSREVADVQGVVGQDVHSPTRAQLYSPMQPLGSRTDFCQHFLGTTQKLQVQYNEQQG
jgi:hypothetical protein